MLEDDCMTLVKVRTLSNFCKPYNKDIGCLNESTATSGVTGEGTYMVLGDGVTGEEIYFGLGEGAYFGLGGGVTGEETYLGLGDGAYFGLGYGAFYFFAEQLFFFWPKVGLRHL